MATDRAVSIAREPTVEQELLVLLDNEKSAISTISMISPPGGRNSQSWPAHSSQPMPTNAARSGSGAARATTTSRGPRSARRLARHVEPRRIVGDVAKRERRVPVGSERAVGVEADAPAPAQHADVEFEQGVGIVARERIANHATTVVGYSAIHKEERITKWGISSSHLTSHGPWLSGSSGFPRPGAGSWSEDRQR